MVVLSALIIKIIYYLLIHCTEILFPLLIDIMLFFHCLFLSVSSFVVFIFILVLSTSYYIFDSFLLEFGQ